MSKRIDPLHYYCRNCGKSETFYKVFYSEDIQAFRDYHYNDELCLLG